MTTPNQIDQSKDIEKLDIPTAVTVAPVLSMIVAYTRNDKVGFKDSAYKVARELELNNKEELALYIYAQFGDVNTFNITD